MKEIIENALRNSFSYQGYRNLHEKLVHEKRTTGPNQTENLIGFTKLNHSRSNRWEKRYEPIIDFSAFNPDTPEIWLIIAEPWCGDAAQNIPVINKIAERMPHVEVRIVLRDKNLSLMDIFLSNGSRSIPKLIRLERSTLDVLDTWGARPAAAKFLFDEYKSNPEITHDMFAENMARWYVENNGRAIEDEFAEMLEKPVFV